MRNPRKVALAVLSAFILVAGAFSLGRFAEFFGWSSRPRPAAEAPTPAPAVPAPTAQAPAAAPPAPATPLCGVAQVPAQRPAVRRSVPGTIGYGGETIGLGRGFLEGFHPTFAPDGREIAFVKEDSGIWITDLEGRNLRPLTANKSPDPVGGGQPAWSPDGSRIAFVSGASGNADIWVIGRDGSKLTRLTTDPARDEQPAWSPDGNQITFVSDRAGTRNIWIVNADGNGLRQIANVTEPPGNQNYPRFSPDGSRIIFSQSVYSKVGLGHLYVGNHLAIINADGTGPCQLTTGNVRDTTSSWSKNGIVFSRSCCALWLILPDGSRLETLTTVGGSNPAWSPDGTKIAFDDGEHIYVLNFIDRTVKPLTQLKVLPLVIYIRPGLANSINPKSTDRIPVAILSTPWFDPVRLIDRSSITFGPTGGERAPIACVADEVNQDGVPDLVCEFDVAARFTPTHREGVLKARDVNGFLLEGRDAVSVLSP